MEMVCRWRENNINVVLVLEENNSKVTFVVVVVA